MAQTCSNPPLLHFPPVLDMKAFLRFYAFSSDKLGGCEATDPISLLALNTNYCCDLNRLLSVIYPSIFCKNGPDFQLLARCTFPEVVVSRPFEQQKSNSR